MKLRVRRKRISTKIIDRYSVNARILNEVRNREGYSLRDLGDEIGVNASTLCRLENGKEVGAFAYLAAMLWATLHNRNVT